MMARVLILAALVALGVAAPAHGAGEALQAFQCTPRSIEYHENGVLAKGKLRAPAKLAGYPCRRWVRLHSSGALKQLELAESITLQGMEIPKGSTVFLHDDGVLDECWFSADVTVQKLPCNGGGKISTRFHPNGLIKSCFLAKDTEIDGVPCKASLLVPVTFHERGQLQSCLLAKDYTVNGTAFKRGDRLFFDESGVAMLAPENELPSTDANTPSERQ